MKKYYLLKILNKNLGHMVPFIVVFYVSYYIATKNIVAAESHPEDLYSAFEPIESDESIGGAILCALVGIGIYLSLKYDPTFPGNNPK